MEFKHILLALLVLSLIVGIGSAAEKNKTFDGGLNDIIDKKEMTKAAKSAWDGGLSTPGYIVIGIVIAIAIAAIVTGVFAGGAQMVLGQVKGSNDEHAKGRSLITVAACSAILMIIALVIISLVFASW